MADFKRLPINSERLLAEILNAWNKLFLEKKAVYQRRQIGLAVEFFNLLFD